VFLVGLSVILAVVMGVASMALAANGKPFLLGRTNVATAVSTLVKKGAGPALDLRVGSGPPLRVNSSAPVANLNADKVDGQDASSLAPVGAFGAERVIFTYGPLPVQETYTSKGGTLVIMASGSGFRDFSNRFGGFIGMNVKVDGEFRGAVNVYTNERGSHKAFVSDYIVVEGLPAGSHTIRLENIYDGSLCGTASESDSDHCTSTNDGDNFSATVMELPAN
jgi:hypothetical protein